MYVIQYAVFFCRRQQSLFEQSRKLQFLDLKVEIKYLLSKERNFERQNDSASFREWILPNSKETGSYALEL